MTTEAKSLNFVEAALNYADGGHRSRLVPIHDARAISEQLSLDRQGFALLHHESAIVNFYDKAEVLAVYYPEVERLLKEVTGASRVVPFEHDVRRAAQRGAGDVREPVRVVHDDYTEKSAPDRVRLYLPGEADRLLLDHYAVINVWRPINGPVRDTPLAVCDARSLAVTDLIPTESGVKHEVYLFNFSPHHRWFYFSGMRNDEALLLKCFDSMRDGRARFTAHTAFDDPSAPPNPPARESIEVRALVFFAD
ncbi:MAG: methyltransferase [Candidatus Binataceae bacterium]|nr:methyltransferase [Candidatus Binataceae bacterium]